MAGMLRERRGSVQQGETPGSALTGFETGIALVNDVNATAAADDSAVLVALLRVLQGIDHLHRGRLREWRAKAGSTIGIGSPPVNGSAAPDLSL
jgi:hypothetical protein